MLPNDEIELKHLRSVCIGTLSFPFEMRQKSRLMGRLDNGQTIALQVKRGTLLRDNERVQIDDDRYVVVKAAAERVTSAHCTDKNTLARACYHLGNRHVPLQIGETWVRYQPDHVLDQLLLSMGFVLVSEQAPFEPEGGAYAHAHGT